MSDRLVLGLVVVLAIGSAVVAAQLLDRPSSGGSLWTAEPGNGRSTLLGIADGSGINRADDDRLRADLDAVVEVGAGWIRLDIDWSLIESEPGQYEWEATDRVVGEAHDRGLLVLGLLTYTPPWARPAGTTEKHPPTDPDHFGRFAAVAVERYGDQVEAWEIWNEPNSGLFWTDPDPDRYADLLVAAVPSIRTADPTATIVTGGLAPADDQPGSEISPETFLVSLLDVVDTELIDAIGIHPYSFPADPSDGSLDWNLFARLPELHRQVAEEAGRPLPIWLTEFGAPFDPDRPDRQAEILSEALHCAARWPWVGSVFVYSLSDSADDPGSRAFGLLDPSGGERPAWSAVRRWVSDPWGSTPSACEAADG